MFPPVVVVTLALLLATIALCIHRTYQYAKAVKVLTNDLLGAMATCTVAENLAHERSDMYHEALIRLAQLPSNASMEQVMGSLLAIPGVSALLVSGADVDTPPGVTLK